MRPFKIYASRWIILLTVLLVCAETASLFADWYNTNQILPAHLQNTAIHQNSRKVTDQSRADQLQLAVFEDKTGILSLSDVSDPGLAAAFQPADRSALIFGQTNATYWLRIVPRQPGFILTVFNPTVEFLTFYLPDGRMIRTGWGDPGRSPEANFVYPHVELTNRAPVYVQMSSSYLQSYTVRLLTNEQFNHLVFWSVAVMTIFLTILLTLTGLHALYFRRSQERIHLAFASFLLINTLHQAGLLGVYRMLPDPVGSILMARTSSFGLVMIVTSAWFAAVSLTETRQVLWARRVFQATLAIGTMIALYGVFSVDRIYSQSATLFATLVVVEVEVLAIFAFREQPSTTRNFLVAWSVLSVGFGVYFLRSQGYLPNNETTLGITNLIILIEAFIFSASAADTQKRLQTRAEANELAFLRAQIKPHFIYNTLSAIIAYIHTEPPRALQLINDFGSFLRSNFEFDATHAMVTVQKELDTVQAFLNIEKALYGDRIALALTADPRVLGWKIPALIIQPLVENALRHGILKCGTGGHIQLDIAPGAEGLHIVVADDGLGMNAEQQADLLLSKDLQPDRNGRVHVGLANVRRRLAVFHHSELAIESSPDKGTIVTVLLKGEFR